MDKKQENLFNGIIKLKDRIGKLSSYVQNDWERMKEDGMFTKEVMKITSQEMLSDFNDAINKLEDLKEDCWLLLSKYWV